MSGWKRQGEVGDCVAHKRRHQDSEHARRGHKELGGVTGRGKRDRVAV